MREPTGRPRVVLHVVHGLGSGVERVVHDYAQATPELEHHVLHSTDPGCHGSTWATSTCFASVEEVDGSLPGFAAALRRTHRRLRPDLVHAHSSVAGAVARVLLGRARVVYTPHCYAFERHDVGLAARAAFWLVEAALGPRTSAVAACSPREEQLARRLCRRVHYVPNIASGALPPHSGAARDHVEVVAAGRISPQKAPEAFAELAEAIGDRDGRVRFTWVGAGSEESTRRLEGAGVRVTGWVDHDEALAAIGAGDVYVHTARWEATPLTILEAARLGVPVLARSTAPIRAMGVAGLWSTTADLVDRVEALVETGDVANLHASNERLRRIHAPERQREALRCCYDTVAGVPLAAAPSLGAAS